MEAGLPSPWPFLIVFRPFSYRNLLIFWLLLPNFQAFKKLISAITISWPEVLAFILYAGPLLSLAYKSCQLYWIASFLCKAIAKCQHLHLNNLTSSVHLCTQFSK